MRVAVTQVLPVYPDYMYIQWTVEDKDSTLRSVDILRSQSPEGPFQVLDTLGPTEYSFRDSECNLLGINRAYWYMVRVKGEASDSTFALSDPKTTEYSLTGHRAQLARKSRRDLKIQLERLNGVPIIILKRRTFGPRCTACFNELTNDVMYSHCNTCYGTSYEGGYHDPIYIHGKLDPISLQESIGTSGPNEMAVTGLTIADFPNVALNDIVIEVKTNRRFRVMRKISSESSRVVVHQDLQVSEISKSGIEYSIPVRLIQ